MASTKNKIIQMFLIQTFEWYWIRRTRNLSHRYNLFGFNSRILGRDILVFEHVIHGNAHPRMSGGFGRDSPRIFGCHHGTHIFLCCNLRNFESIVNQMDCPNWKSAGMEYRVLYFHGNFLSSRDHLLHLGKCRCAMVGEIP